MVCLWQVCVCVYSAATLAQVGVLAHAAHGLFTIHANLLLISLMDG